MLYTVVPIDDVLEGMEEEPAPTMELIVGGVLMELEPQGDFQAKVVRIISSDPQDYLASQHQPGSIVRWT
jgi:hypothetical protein